MKLITGKLLGKSWLKDILEKSRSSDVSEVKAAIAYANGTPELLEYCFSENLPLTFWCRYDHTVPVSPRILERFLRQGVINQTCKLLPEFFHPKVIWWRDFGAYIGSANLTDNGWIKNVECGLFLTESEMISHGIMEDLESFFEKINALSTPLSKEIYEHLLEQERSNREFDMAQRGSDIRFSKNRIIPKNDSLVKVDERESGQKRKEAFLKEWFETLEKLRTIQDIVSKAENRPSWIKEGVSKGVQADQFLHAFYYNKVRKGRKYPFEVFFNQNKARKEAALQDAIDWWKTLPHPPSGEDVTINEWAPFVKDALERKSLTSFTKDALDGICAKVHSIRDHATKIDNVTLGVTADSPQKAAEECYRLFSNYLWTARSTDGLSVRDVLLYVLYSGESKDVPSRIFDATTDPKYKIPHFGISSIGELVGWAFPDLFPPRNDRTNKALRSLGFDVTVRSGVEVPT